MWLLNKSGPISDVKEEVDDVAALQNLSNCVQTTQSNIQFRHSRIQSHWTEDESGAVIDSVEA